MHFMSAALRSCAAHSRAWLRSRTPYSQAYIVYSVPGYHIIFEPLFMVPTFVSTILNLPAVMS